MDVRFYPPPAQPAAAPDAPCLGPSPCLDPYYCNKVNALLLFPPCSRCWIPGGGRRRRPGRRGGGPGGGGQSRARGSPPAAAVCAPVVNIVERLGGLSSTAIVRKVTRFARVFSFLLFATKDPCLGLPGGV